MMRGTYPAMRRRSQTLRQIVIIIFYVKKCMRTASTYRAVKYIANEMRYDFSIRYSRRQPPTAKARPMPPTPSTECDTRSLAGSALTVSGLRHVYGSHVAVDDVSWQAGAGEAVCLLGHSGCGKTTLLRAVAGLEPVAGGSIRLAGELVAVSYTHLTLPTICSV